MATEIIKQPKWKVVEYSRSQIIKAGKAARNENASEEEKNHAIKVIDNWRAAHAFPLHVIYMHLRRMSARHPDVIVAERLKRIDSILNKLKREKNMSLWTMQDLGGCRVVVPTIEDVYFFADKYEQSRKRHILIDTNDYIREPKDSGYRSLHRIYEYHSDSKETYNRNMLIELQFRTHLQHLWATAVETMGVFTNSAIKSGQGSDDVNRFFSIVSSLFAIREKQPIVPGTVDDEDELISELEDLNSKHNYIDFLSGINVAIDFQERKGKKDVKKPAYFMLILNYNTKRLSIRTYKASEFDEVNELYNTIENNKQHSQIDAVLVRVTSVGMLKKAYPNYFSDLTEFVHLVKTYLKY